MGMWHFCAAIMSSIVRELYWLLLLLMWLLLCYHAFKARWRPTWAQAGVQLLQALLGACALLLLLE